MSADTHTHATHTHSGTNQDAFSFMFPSVSSVRFRTLASSFCTCTHTQV